MTVYVIIWLAICCAIGAASILQSVRRLKQARHLEEVCTSETTGIVIGYRTGHDNDSDGHRYKVFHPIFQYSVGGVTVKYIGEYATNERPFRLGDTVNVMYNPDKIDECYVKEYFSSRNMVLAEIIILAAILAGFIIVSTLLIR